MGQGTHGLLYGARVPEGVEFSAGAPSLIDRWMLARKGDTLGYEQGIVDHCECDYGDGENLVGVYIAVGASSIRGVPDLDTTVRVDRVDEEAAYADRLAWARAEWAAFTEWCANEGVDLDAPGLWLVGLEVA